MTMRLYKPIFTIYIIISHLCSLINSYDHKQLFPPNDEYDPVSFNEENLYGAPYGGFGRAYRSRIAKLPMHLADNSVFGFFNDENTSEEDINEKKDENETNTNMKENVYFNMREKNGQQFACKIYEADELSPESLSSSMFDMAIEKDESDKNGKENSENKIEKAKEKENKKFDQLTAVLEADIPLLDVLEKRIIPQLIFGCLEVQEGYWKYKWCDEKDVIQYHGDTIISLGDFDKKMMFLSISTDSGPYAATLLHEFDGGETCKETGKNRRIEVEMHCCSTVEMHRKNANMMRENTSDDVYFMKVEETRTCHYVGKSCSPLLCSDNLLKERKLMAENMTTTIMKSTENNSFEDLSVREILEIALGKRCLSKNAGWWTYEFCYLKFVREFHANTVVNVRTGKSHMEIETEHSLGKYDSEIDDYDEEEETHRMSNSPTSIYVADDEVNWKNGPMFIQEYKNGDVCDHDDVTDSAIKGGSVGNGGIERSTLIRYSCGKWYDLVQVNEDSSCHYIIDVTVPELCEHPFFKIELASSKVVKCLPVDENTYA